MIPCLNESFQQQHVINGWEWKQHVIIVMLLCKWLADQGWINIQSTGRINASRRFFFKSIHLTVWLTFHCHPRLNLSVNSGYQKLILTVQLVKRFNNQYPTFPVIIYLLYVKHCTVSYTIHVILLYIYFTNMLPVLFLLKYCQWCWQLLPVGRGYFT